MNHHSDGPLDKVRVTERSSLTVALRLGVFAWAGLNRTDPNRSQQDDRTGQERQSGNNLRPGVLCWGCVMPGGNVGVSVHRISAVISGYQIVYHCRSLSGATNRWTTGGESGCA